MNSEQKNLAYWFNLPLWPLDAACRLLCDADVNDPDQTPLSMRNPATRPAWVNLFHMATADDEIEIIEGKGGARGVTPAAFIEWARSNGYGLDSKFDTLLKIHIPAARVEVARGLDKRKVMAAFQDIKWDYDKWGKNLASPSNKLKACRIALGNKKTSALWNPADIGLYLLDEGVELKPLDTVFMRLNDWVDEWRDKTVGERN
jgi:hypothetical protein